MCIEPHIVMAAQGQCNTIILNGLYIKDAITRKRLLWIMHALKKTCTSITS